MVDRRLLFVSSSASPPTPMLTPMRYPNESCSSTLLRLYYLAGLVCVGPRVWLPHRVPGLGVDPGGPLVVEYPHGSVIGVNLTPPAAFSPLCSSTLPPFIIIPGF
ncbi:hypothetical protein KSP40_PGU014895 [Platanthera guangdongensis]|uniref:Uncharacterized protein n=1 Tax=Platanthera guangdongensis TaxID=2320717 RepID=A0ABR2N3M0_9ASPA